MGGMGGWCREDGPEARRRCRRDPEPGIGRTSMQPVLLGGGAQIRLCRIKRRRGADRRPNWIGPGDLLLDGTRSWIRSARRKQVWLLQIAEEYAADPAPFLAGRRRLGQAGGFWDAPPDGLREE